MQVLYLVFILLCSTSLNAHANAHIPKKDLEGASDIEFLGRYDGSYIIAFQKKNFDRFILPTGRLKPCPNERDAHNNILFKPGKSLTIMGEHKRIVYLCPETVFPLEVLYNYKEQIRKEGG